MGLELSCDMCGITLREYEEITLEVNYLFSYTELKTATDTQLKNKRSEDEKYICVNCKRMKQRLFDDYKQALIEMSKKIAEMHDLESYKKPTKKKK